MESRSDPTEQLEIVAFGDDGHLVVIEIQITVGIRPNTRQYVAAYDTEILARTLMLYSGCHDRLHDGGTRDERHVFGLGHFGTRNGDRLPHIDRSGIEQAPDKGYVLYVYGPHRLPFVDGRYVVYLYADVTGRMRALKKMLCGIPQAVEHTVLAVAQPQVDLPVGQLLQCLDTGSQVVVLVFQDEVHVRSQGGGIESRNKDRFRFVARIGDRSVRPLDDEGPKPALQQHLGDFLRSGLGRNGSLEFFVFDHRIGIDHYGQYPSLFATTNGRYGTAHRRGEEYLGPRLVEKQRGTRLHPGAFRNEQFRGNARKAIRNHGISGADRHLDHRLFRFAYQPDVETTFQFYDFRHIMIIDMSVSE